MWVAMREWREKLFSACVVWLGIYIYNKNLENINSIIYIFRTECGNYERRTIIKNEIKTAAVRLKERLIYRVQIGPVVDPNLT
jgi:hypothetical protein